MSPTTGTGQMTPAAPGAPGVGLDIAQPIPYTLLSLHRYAKIMGINPLHFARGGTPGLKPIIFPVVGCDDIWYKYDWQDHDKVSWWQLAHLILDAEQEIANLVGYWPAPTWIVSEEHRYPAPFHREYYGAGTDLRGDMKGKDTRYGKIIYAGRRTATKIGTATTLGASLVYSDEDSDGFFETATITLPTALTDIEGIKVYFSGTDANPDWEIRPVRSITFSGANIVIVMDSWLFIDPELYEEYPNSNGIEAIDVSTIVNFVISVDVYREYVDAGEPSVEFFWESRCQICNGSGCSACSPVTQDGCLIIRNSISGIVAPVPATYNVVEGVWQNENWTEYIEPDRMRFWYMAGDIDQRYHNRYSTDPLSHFWAQVIAWIATARLERPLCGCGNVQALAADLQTDLSSFPRTESRYVYPDVYGSPFGTRKGEVMAWRRIKHLVKDKKASFAVI